MDQTIFEDDHPGSLDEDSSFVDIEEYIYHLIDYHVHNDIDDIDDDIHFQRFSENDVATTTPTEFSVILDTTSAFISSCEDV